MVAICYHKNMEKKKAHFNLIEVKRLIEANQYTITRIASINANNDFNFKNAEIIYHVLKLESKNFYKSMTSNNNPKIWQDVYHSCINSDYDIAYIKIQIVKNKTVVIQFKQK